MAASAAKYTHLATDECEALELDNLPHHSASHQHSRSQHTSCTLLTFKNLLYFLSAWCVVLILLYYYNFGSLSINQLKSYFFSSSDLPTTDESLINAANSTKYPFDCNPINSDFKPYTATFNGVTYPRSIILNRNKSINFDCLNKSPNIKRILFWTPFFDDRSFGFGDLGAVEPLKKNKCPVVNCELTDDKKLVNSSDLVLLHMRDSIETIPSYRPPNQRWVFVLYESPVHSGDFTPYNGVFNLTTTYRRDGDFPGFYESDAMMRWAPNEKFDESKDFTAHKRHFAAIVVSNCGASNRRLDYVRELQKYIQVDIFGKCGKPCPTHLESNNQTADCKFIIGTEYKFYFAFENSNCVDYITEKFFTILQYDIIPVVLGGGTYDHYIPSSGYINVLDYDSPKKLADYLVYLSENPSAYNAYFKWKKHVLFDQVPIHFSTICNMCIQMHLEEVFGMKRQIIQDIGTYWGQRENCIVPKLGI